jgi:electron transfer flavoprotein alpha subunit
MKKQILVIADYHQNEVAPATLELITAASELNNSRIREIAIVLAGCSIQPAVAHLADNAGCSVLGLEIDASAGYLEEQSAAALVAEIESDPPEYVCIAHTVRGVSLAGALAVRLNAACITGVENIVRAGDDIEFERSVSGGKFTATLASNAATTVLTIQPGVFEPAQQSVGSQSRVNIKTVPPRRERIKAVGLKPAISGAADLANARTIVAAGQGVGSPENLDLIHRLAACFSNSAVAGTRIVCDLGWLGYDRQVGISGSTVAPDLYLACGVSGALQHIMGMRGSRLVVAVNKDANAAIFREADVCIVEDLMVFIPAFLDALANSD